MQTIVCYGLLQPSLRAPARKLVILLASNCILGVGFHVMVE
jgi:hypothetical protein